MRVSESSAGEHFVLLQQEGYLLQSCLRIGLSQLANSQLSEKGTFYGAFFNLSVGIERLSKAIILIDHYIRNDLTFPSANELKGFGHDLSKLYERVEAIATARVLAVDFTVVHEPLTAAMLSQFSVFAMRTRYSNLNNLNRGSRIDDPLSAWMAILRRVFEYEVPKAKQRQVGTISKMLGPELDSKGGIIAWDLEARALNFQLAFQAGGIIKAATPYALLRVVTALKSLQSVLRGVNAAAHEAEQASGFATARIPYMWEFLTFLNRDRASTLRAKAWR